MKFVVVALVIFVVWTFALRTRRRDTPGGRARRSRRRSRMFTNDDGAVDVRSADNVRLISDEQLDAAERTEE